MDPDMVPDLLWKQGNLCNPKPDEDNLNLFPNLLEDAILTDEISGFPKGNENDIGSILLEKVDGSDLIEDQKEDLLKSSVCWDLHSYKIGLWWKQWSCLYAQVFPFVYGNLENVCVYIDDILIASSDWTSHLESLRGVFKTTRDAKLRIAVKKSSLRFLLLTMWGSTSEKMGSNLKRFIRIPSYNLLSLRR
jgi:hypothetical protein